MRKRQGNETKKGKDIGRAKGVRKGQGKGTEKGKGYGRAKGVRKWDEMIYE